MVTRIKWAALALLLGLQSCCLSAPAQVDPLLNGMDQLKTMFEAEQTNTRQLVASGNPPPATFEAFLQAQKGTYDSFMDVYNAMARQVASIGQFSQEETLELMDRITSTIVTIRGGDGQ